MATIVEGARAPRLLVVDDATIMRMRIAGIAREAGWDVVAEAVNGREGLARYAEHRPDLVTLDIVMPELDGVETLRELHRTDPDARVVMVSAVDQRAKLRECLALGALDFVVKPFDKERLMSLFTKYAVVVRETAATGPLPTAAPTAQPDAG
jgi:two-component system, chemotaxis family, chemotaxis protein CheY